MTSPGTMNGVGQSSVTCKPTFDVPAAGAAGGGNRDFGSLALMFNRKLVHQR